MLIYIPKQNRATNGQYGTTQIKMFEPSKKKFKK